jgi:hypothetical protein
VIARRSSGSSALHNGENDPAPGLRIHLFAPYYVRYRTDEPRRKPHCHIETRNVLGLAAMVAADFVASPMPGVFIDVSMIADLLAPILTIIGRERRSGPGRVR